MQRPHAILIDTDPGIDDAMALLLLRARPDVRIAGITTVFGNADVATTTRNAVYLAERFGIDAPVIAGASRPLRIASWRAPQHVHGADGLGDVLALPSSKHASIRPAHEFIIEQVHSRPHELNILALGPLTNLALALQTDPSIASLVRQVVIMGGAFGWSGRRGNASPVAEANIYNDPHAAQRVLVAHWPVIMVGLDVTMRCIFTTEAAQRLARDGGEAGQLIWQISRGYEKLYMDHDGLAGCCLHDVAAAVCLLVPELFAVRTGPIHVMIDGAAIGQTVQRPTDSDPAAAPSNLPQHRACYDVDVARLVRFYSESIVHAHAANVMRRVPPPADFA